MTCKKCDAMVEMAHEAGERAARAELMVKDSQRHVERIKTDAIFWIDEGAKQRNTLIRRVRGSAGFYSGCLRSTRGSFTTALGLHPRRSTSSGTTPARS